MLIGQLIVAILVAILASTVSLMVGNGVIFSLLIYTCAGSMTFALLVGWSIIRPEA